MHLCCFSRTSLRFIQHFSGHRVIVTQRPVCYTVPKRPQACNQRRLYMDTNDILLYNGKIYLEKGRFAQAIRIRGGRVAAVGENTELLAGAENAEKIDLAGKTVIPGLIDSHMHLFNVGRTLRAVRLHGAGSLAEVLDRCRAYLAENRPEPGSVIVGRGWNHDYFTDEHRMPNRHDLDKVTTDHALILTRACGHALVCNTRALEMAGVTAQTPQPAGGAFELDGDGRPNGIFKEHAMDLIQRLITDPSFEESRRILQAAMAHASAHGITSVQTNDMYEDNYQRVWNAYQSLADDGLATVRAYQQCGFSTVEGYEKFLRDGFRTGFGSPMNRIGPLKLLSDGSLGARTALLRQDYSDKPGTRGILCVPPEQLDAFVSLSAQNGMQVAIHAIGDRAIELVLDAYEKAWPDGGNPRRSAIVHCQITDRPLLERFAHSHTAALVQPIFLHYDMHIVEDRVGPALAASSYAFGTMDRLGIHNSYGTDSPVEDLNTMENLYCAVTRRDLTGWPDGGWQPEEAVDVASAVDHYTVDSAWNSFEEDVKGRLLPGMYADLAVLSDDIFTIDPRAIKNVRVLMTMMDGRVVYRA